MFKWVTNETSLAFLIRGSTLKWTNGRIWIQSGTGHSFEVSLLPSVVMGHGPAFDHERHCRICNNFVLRAVMKTLSHRLSSPPSSRIGRLLNITSLVPQHIFNTPGGGYNRQGNPRPSHNLSYFAISLVPAMSSDLQSALELVQMNNYISRRSPIWSTINLIDHDSCRCHCRHIRLLWVMLLCMLSFLLWGDHFNSTIAVLTCSSEVCYCILHMLFVHSVTENIQRYNMFG